MADPAAAFKLRLSLAQQDSVWSMVAVAICYERGDGIARDAAEAENWYRRAFAGGSQSGMYECARLAAYRKDYTACKEILQVGVEQGWAPAIFWLAWYRHKQSESRETYRQIKALLADAAGRRHTGAQFFLLNFMVTGKFGYAHIPKGFVLVMIYAVRTALEPSTIRSLSGAMDETSSA